MNYFAHGRHAIQDPERLAGTALPDWLSAANRGARLRRTRLDAKNGAAWVVWQTSARWKARTERVRNGARRPGRTP